jgi:hypothetical protein
MCFSNKFLIGVIWAENNVKRLLIRISLGLNMIRKRETGLNNYYKTN